VKPNLFWTTAIAHCATTITVVLTTMGWTMWLLDTGHREAPLPLQLLSVLQWALVWPLLYPLARVALQMGFSDPLAPIYWLMPPLNSGVVGLLIVGLHNQLRRRRRFQADRLTGR
jgi:hypothetical protein